MLVSPSGHKKKKLRTTASTIIVLQTAAAVTMLVQSISLAAFLGPDGYGLIYTTVAAANVIGVLSTLGWPARLMKSFAQASNKNEIPNWIAVSVLDSTLGLAIILLTVSFFDLGTPFWPLILLSASRTSLSILMGVMQGFNKATLYILLVNIFLPLFTSCLTIILGKYYNASPLIFFAVGTTLYTIVLLIFLLSRHGFIKNFTNSFEWSMTFYTSRRENMILYLSAIGNVFLSFSDALAIGKYMSHLDSGYYGILIALTSIISLCMPAINAMYGPEVGPKIKKQNFETARSIFRRYRAVALLWSIPSALIIIMLSPAISQNVFNMHLNFTLMAALSLLILGQIINCYTGPVAVALYMNGFIVASSLPIAVYGIVHIFIMIFATINFGIIGASAVTMLGTSGVNMYQYIYSLRKGIL